MRQRLTESRPQSNRGAPALRIETSRARANLPESCHQSSDPSCAGPIQVDISSRLARINAAMNMNERDGYGACYAIDIRALRSPRRAHRSDLPLHATNVDPAWLVAWLYFPLFWNLEQTLPDGSCENLHDNNRDIRGLPEHQLTSCLGPSVTHGNVFPTARQVKVSLMTTVLFVRRMRVRSAYIYTRCLEHRDKLYVCL